MRVEWIPCHSVETFAESGLGSNLLVMSVNLLILSGISSVKLSNMVSSKGRFGREAVITCSVNLLADSEEQSDETLSR